MEKIGTNNLYIAESKIFGAGRGVFARSEIKKGEQIEICPVIGLSEGEVERTNETVLATYSFYCGQDLDRAVIALGYGSIYNHSYRPNAIYEIDEEGRLMTFTAITNIGKDEEIVVNYNRESVDKTPLWFE